MSQTMMTKPEMKKQDCSTAVEFFSAKLDCEMTPQTLKGMMDKKSMGELCLIDVRDAAQYAAGRLPHAVNIPLQDLAGKLALLPKDKTVVAYCGDMTCGMAPKACLELAHKGYKAMMLLGGFAGWMEKGFPVDQKA